MATLSLQSLLPQALGSEGGKFFFSNGNQEFKMKSASLNFCELPGIGKTLTKHFSISKMIVHWQIKYLGENQHLRKQMEDRLPHCDQLEIETIQYGLK